MMMIWRTCTTASMGSRLFARRQRTQTSTLDGAPHRVHGVVAQRFNRLLNARVLELAERFDRRYADCGGRIL